MYDSSLFMSSYERQKLIVLEEEAKKKIRKQEFKFKEELKREKEKNEAILKIASKDKVGNHSEKFYNIFYSMQNGFGFTNKKVLNAFYDMTNEEIEYVYKISSSLKIWNNDIKFKSDNVTKNDVIKKFEECGLKKVTENFYDNFLYVDFDEFVKKEYKKELPKKMCEYLLNNNNVKKMKLDSMSKNLSLECLYSGTNMKKIFELYEKSTNQDKFCEAIVLNIDNNVEQISNKKNFKEWEFGMKNLLGEDYKSSIYYKLTELKKTDEYKAEKVIKMINDSSFLHFEIGDDKSKGEIPKETLAEIFDKFDIDSYGKIATIVYIEKNIDKKVLNEIIGQCCKDKGIYGMQEVLDKEIVKTEDVLKWSLSDEGSEKDIANAFLQTLKQNVFKNNKTLGIFDYLETKNSLEKFLDNSKNKNKEITESKER